jgi:3-hydroxyacyl-[acyl-carrier-protein] dehydratase
MDMSASTNSPQTLESLDIMRLLELLPHRYPFLMVDRIVDILDDESCIGIKNVTINEPQFAGHFPERPIMPGVLLIEGMAQTAGAVCILRFASGQPKLVYFMTIDKCKFRKPVVPGDVVHYHVRKIRNRKTIWKYAAEARVDGVLVAEAEISAMIADK